MCSLVIDCLHQFNSLHLLNLFYFFLAQLMDTHLKSSKPLFHLLLTFPGKQFTIPNSSRSLFALSISFSLYFYSHTFGLRIFFHLTNKFIYSSSAWSCTHLFDLLFYVSLSIFHFPSFSFKAVFCSIKKVMTILQRRRKSIVCFLFI